MHCPQCGQKQVHENIKFCSKCGISLLWVAEILKNGGSLPQLENLSANSGCLTRSNGLKFALLWFLVFLMLTPILGILTQDGEPAGVSAVLSVVGSILICALSLMFLKNPKYKGALQPAELENRNAINKAANFKELARGEQSTAREYVAPAETWKAPDTDDLVRPASVTEGTTKLLQMEDEDKDLEQG